MSRSEHESTETFIGFLSFISSSEITVDNMRKAYMMFLEHDGYSFIVPQDLAKERLFEHPLRYLQSHPGELKLPKDYEAAIRYFFARIPSFQFPQDISPEARAHAAQFLGALSQAI